MAARNVKDFKKLIILVIGAIFILAAFVIFLSPSKGPDRAEGPEVMASRRVRIDMEAMTGKTDEKGQDAAAGQEASSTPPETAQAAPGPVAAQKPATEPEKAAKIPPPAEPAPAARTEPVKAAPKPVQKTAEPRKTTTARAATAAKTSDNWAINVASFREKAQAEKLRSRLKSAGYNAYTTEFVKDGKEWNRVRVGFFSTNDEAKKTGREIASRFNVSQNPWVVRPTTDEISSYSR